MVLASPARGVVGGAEPAFSDTQFDSVCAITIERFLEQDNSFGSGTLIRPNVVLTAKHVLAGVPNDVPYVAFRRRVDGQVAGIRGSELGGNGHQFLHVVRVVEKIPWENSDFELLILETAVTHIEPMQYDLDTLSAPVGSTLAFAGWGSESTTLGLVESTGPRRLKMGSFTRPARSFKTLMYGPAGYVQAGIASPAIALPGMVPAPNQQDSGGPLMRFLPTGKPVVIGVLFSLAPMSLSDPEIDAGLGSVVVPPGSGGFGGVWEPLTGLTMKDPLHKAFLLAWAQYDEGQSSSIGGGTLSGAFAYEANSPVTFSANGYMILQNKLVYPEPPNYFARSEPMVRLFDEKAVSVSSSGFAFASTMSGSVRLDNPAFSQEICTPGQMASKFTSEVAVLGTGTKSLVTFRYDPHLQHEASFVGIDSRVESGSFLRSVDTPSGGATGSIASFRVTFKDATNRASTRLSISGESNVSSPLRCIVEVDYNDDGIFDRVRQIDAIAKTDDDNIFVGYRFFRDDADLGAFEPLARYRITMQVKSLEGAIRSLGAGGCGETLQSVEKLQGEVVLRISAD